MEFNAPVRIGTATVLPGDVVVGEDEGVLFFPPEMLDRVLTAATETERREAYERELLLQKKYRFRDIYPLSPARGVRQEQEAAVNLTFLLWRELHEHVCNVSALGHEASAHESNIGQRID